MRILIALILIAALFMTYNCGPAKVDIEAEKEQVEAALEKVHEAFKKGDIGLLSELYRHDSDILVIDPGSQRWTVGWESIEKMYNNFFNNYNLIEEEIIDEKIKISPTGKTAWVAHKLAGKIIGETKTNDLKRWGTLILEKTGNKWQIVHVQESSVRK